MPKSILNQFNNNSFEDPYILNFNQNIIAILMVISQTMSKHVSEMLLNARP